MKYIKIDKQKFHPKLNIRRMALLNCNTYMLNQSLLVGNGSL